METSDNELFQQVHVFSSFFYKKLTEKEGYAHLSRFILRELTTVGRRNKGNPYESVKKWTSKFNLFNKKYIILPINEKWVRIRITIPPLTGWRVASIGI